MVNCNIIIPARKNSKRVVNKNKKLLNHIYLIEYTLRFCSQFFKNNKIIVSSDDSDIECICNKYKVIYDNRPSNLCLDNTSTIDVLQYICKKYKIKDSPVLLLQPTSPIRSYNTFKIMYEIYKNNNDTIVTVEEIENSRIGNINENIYKPINYNFADRCQDIKKLFTENGNMYIFNSNTLLDGKFYDKEVYSYLISGDETIDIDIEQDLQLAEVLIQNSIHKKIKTIIVKDDIKIGLDQKCFIIAEACDNHLGRMDYAYRMIDVAYLAGADAVKFQHHLPDEEMLKDVPMSNNFKEPLYDILKKYSLTLQQHRELKKYCDKLGILYMCTPFSKKAADEIEDLVDLYKIGSGELTDHPTLIEIAKKGKPMIISTGMATIDEIEETLNIIRPINDKIMIMNCTSEYPPNYKDINVKLIPKLQERFGIIVGHSDHTPDNYTCFAAVSCGAKLMEKHFILDKLIPGPDQNVSIDPMGLNDWVSGIRKIEDALGEDKSIHNLEKPIKEWARRSIVTIKDIKQGEEFSLDNLWCKRPGTGIPSKHLFEIIGKKADEDISKDKLLNKNYLI